MTEDRKGYASRLRMAALMRPAEEVYAVLYGSHDSLSKRHEIKEKVEALTAGVTVYILDDLDFSGGIASRERVFARGAIANIFLIDPSWMSYGADHELTTVIESNTRQSVVLIRPDEGDWDNNYSSQAAKEIADLIPGQCHRYPVNTWEQCDEITYICNREIRNYWKLLELLPNRTTAPPQLE